jgi:2-oxoglutarate dehydrogenase E2 component (dihydrolipoamide succinyltransferase)
VPSTAEGVIEAILYKENDVVPIGTVIAKIKVGASTQSASPVAQTYATAPIEEIKVVDEIPYQPVQIDNNSQQNANRFYSPLVLNIAQSEGVSMSDLEKIKGSGQDGRVTKKDILAFVSSKSNTVSTSLPTNIIHEVSVVNVTPITTNPQPLPTVYQGNVEIIEMDRMIAFILHFIMTAIIMKFRKFIH